MTERQACTDFELVPQQTTEVQISVDLELSEGADPRSLQPELLLALQQYIAPRFPFQGLKVFAKDKLIEAVFDGPSPQQGFLEREDLARFQPRRDIRRSDLIHALMEVSPAIRAIRSLSISTQRDQAIDEWRPIQEWLVELKHPPRLVKAEFLFSRQGIQVAHITAEGPALEQPVAPAVSWALDFPLIPGRNRQVGRYTSIRQHLPEIYGIGPKGIPGPRSAEREAQARQLSAYLLLFEQILANSFMQLGESWRLFTPFRDDEDTQSYWINELGQLNGGALGHGLPLVNHSTFTGNDAPQRAEALHTQTEREAQRLTRNHRFLDHLLARFGESMQDYQRLVEDLFPDQPALSVLAKRRFLREWETLSAQRGLGPDYTQDTAWDTEAVGGLKRRIAAKLGLPATRQNLDGDQAGFFLIEHLLLRPIPEDELHAEALMGAMPQADPYSFQLTYIFPQASSAAFQDFVAQTLQEETPAHLRYQLFWLSGDELTRTQNFYRAWLEQLHAYRRNPEQADLLLYRLSRDEMIDQLHCLGKTFGLTYPIRNLHVEAILTVDPNNNAQTSITIHGAQRGVRYQLLDRNQQASGLPSGIIAEDITEAQGANRSLAITFSTPAEDQKYYLQATKMLCGTELDSVILPRPIKVNIGILPREITLLEAEIDYGQQATVIVNDIQAEVNYELRFPFRPEEAISISNQGDEGKDLQLTTNLPTGHGEDTILEVWGSRPGLTAVKVGEVALRVRANPALSFELINGPVYDYGQTSVAITIEGTQGPGRQTQGSVTYALYAREVIDREFVHHRDPRPDQGWTLELSPAPDPWIIEVARPIVDPTGSNPSSEVPAGQTVTFTPVAAGQRPAGGGQDVSFTLPGPLQEDTMFIVVASKNGHDTPIVLGTTQTNRTPAGIQVALVRPRATASYTIDPNPVPSSQRGRLVLNDPQPGVRYFLKVASNGALQPGVYRHVQDSDDVDYDPRRDGVGFSLVGVEIVVGPLAEPLVLQTNRPIGNLSNPTFTLHAQKVQTLLETTAPLATLTFPIDAS